MPKLLNVLEKALIAVSALLFVIMLGVVGVQVVARYIPSLIVSWTEELTRLLFVAAVCFGAPVAMQHEEYVGVDLVTELLSEKVKLYLFGIIYILIAVFCAATFYFGVSNAMVGLNQVSPTLKVPMYILYGLIPACYLLNTVYSLAVALRYFTGKTGKEAN